MKTDSFLSVVALLMTVGCATGSPPLIVGYGRLVNQHEDFGLSVARYEISGLGRGILPTNVVDVVFWRKTQTGELPHEAILLLSRPIAVSPPIWHAVGGDATRGILPDTQRDRVRVASLADARVLDSPDTEWLPRPKAERIVRDYLRTEGLDLTRLRLKLRRGEFGWDASVSFPDQHGRVAPGGESYVAIQDCGDILHWTKGL